MDQKIPLLQGGGNLLRTPQMHLLGFVRPQLFQDSLVPRGIAKNEIDHLQMRGSL